MTDLVRWLTASDRPTRVHRDSTGAVTDDDHADLSERLTRMRRVFLAFAGPRGETVLGVSVTGAVEAPERTTGRARIEGAIHLDHVPLRCVADIDLATFEGIARLTASPRASTARGTAA